MPVQEYEEMLKEDRVFILPDIMPWSGIQVIGNDIMDGLVKSVSCYTGSNISSADIQFPKKSFGDHVKGLTPLRICIRDSDTTVFRGFIIEENGILSDTEDTVTVRALDWKWYFSKCTKIRGRWFTTDGAIPEPYGSPNTTGHGKLKYEMFRAPVSRDAGRSGYLQNEECVFNEGGMPTCWTSTREGRLCVFKYRKMTVSGGRQYLESYNYGADYWTFSSILSHIAYWWLTPYEGMFTQIRISSASYSHLSRLKLSDNDDDIPMDLSIEGMNPLDAIDSVVKAIPGKWIWYLRYSGSTVYIEIRNIDDNANVFKKLTIGTNEKLAEGPVSIANLKVTRNWENTSSFLVLKGGKLKFTTTVELQPVWERHTVSGVANLPFASKAEFNEWKNYVKDKKKTDSDKIKVDKYEKAFRHYCIPIEGSFLRDALDAVTFDNDQRLTGRLHDMYSAVEVELKKMLADYASLPRTFDAPDHPAFEAPVFFGYDAYMGKTPKKDAYGFFVDDVKKRIIYYPDGYTFDSDTGLVIFDNPQYCRIDVPEVKEDESIEEDEGSLEEPNKRVDAEPLLSLPDGIENVDDIYKEIVGDTADYPLVSRRIFCTLSIVLDMPYIVGDDIFGLYYNEGGNFSRYVDFEGNDLRIHANAFYPVLTDKKVAITPAAYILASDENKDFAVTVTQDMCENLLYPAKYMNNYERYPDDNHLLLLKKLDNLKKGINRYDETIDADIGILDIGYELGDIIFAIENSATEEDGSGYYMLRDYVAQVTHSLEGENKGYTTTISCTNVTEFTPRDFDKVVRKVMHRPSVFRNIYKKDAFFEEAT